MSIELSVITSFQEFKQCSKIWEDFRQKQTDNTICNNWEWCNTWIEVFFQEKDKLYIHIWIYQNEIIGIIPTYLKNTYAGYELRFIATGEAEKSEICSEFQDFLLHSKYEERILAQFTNKILNNKSISAIIFDNILVKSTVYKWIEKIHIKYWTKKITSSGKRYLIPVQHDQATQHSSFKSKSTKRHVKKFLVDQSWKVNKVDDLTALNIFYQRLIKSHNKNWSLRNKIGAFEDINFVKFHRSFSKKLLKNKQLVAFELTCQTEISALFYGVIDGNTLYYYQSAINHESQLSSAGVAMHVIALNIARDNKLVFYDLMKGSNTSYKKRYIQSDIGVVNFSAITLRYNLVTNFTKLFYKLTCRIGKIVNPQA